MPYSDTALKGTGTPPYAGWITIPGHGGQFAGEESPDAGRSLFPEQAAPRSDQTDSGGALLKLG